MDKLTQSMMSEDILELVWNNTTGAIFIMGYDGTIQNANPSFSMMLGYEIEDLRGKNILPFIYQESQEDHDFFLERLRAGESFPYMPRARKHKDGSVLQVLASYRAVNKDNILAIGMYKDLSEHFAIQQKMSKNERLYRSLVEHLPEAVLKLKNDTIEFVNPAGNRLFGKKKKEMINTSFCDLFDSKHKQKLQHLLDHFYMRKDWEKPVTIEDTLILHENEEIDVEMKVIPIGNKKDPAIQLVVQDVTEKKEHAAQLEYFAYHDPLTGLKNRRIFNQIFKQSLEHAKMNKEKVAILYIDLDEFKEINDEYGHDVGDQLLQKFSKRLMESVRKQDVTSRIGGDEFLVLLQGVENQEQVEAITKRMHETFQEPYDIDGLKLNVTSSIGIAMFPKHGKRDTTLIYRADRALYQAKLEKNHYRFHL